LQQAPPLPYPAHSLLMTSWSVLFPVHQFFGVTLYGTSAVRFSGAKEVRFGATSSRSFFFLGDIKILFSAEEAHGLSVLADSPLCPLARFLFDLFDLLLPFSLLFFAQNTGRRFLLCQVLRRISIYHLVERDFKREGPRGSHCRPFVFGVTFGQDREYIGFVPF